MIRAFGHEQVAYFNNEKAGLKAIIALHNTNLGPAVGGCRLWPYESEEAALFDVLRLSRGMSHKNAAAGMPLSPPLCGTTTLLTFLMILPLTSMIMRSGLVPRTSAALAAA